MINSLINHTKGHQKSLRNQNSRLNFLHTIIKTALKTQLINSTNIRGIHES